MADTNISDILSNIAISRSLITQRISNQLVRDVELVYLEIIDNMLLDIRSHKQIDIKNLNEVLSEIKARLTPDLEVYGELQELGIVEANYIASATNAIVGKQIFKRVPPDSTIMRIMRTSLVSDGKSAHPLKDWLDSIDKSMLKDVEGAVKLGIIQALPTNDIADNVNNIMLKNVNYAKAFTRTAVSELSGQARMAVYLANDEVIKGYEHTSCLCSSTCMVCGNLDGAAWSTDGKGLNAKGKKYRYTPSPIKHLNCKCIHVPVLKSWKDLGIDMEEIPIGTRSSVDGQISQKIKFDDFVKSKSKEWQKDYFGKSRYEMYKKGTIQFSDLINNKNELLTVQELKSKYN